MTAQDIRIRNFQTGDMAKLAGLTSQLGYPTSMEQMAARMNEIAKLENYRTLVAVLDEEVVGYIGLNTNYFWEQDGQYVRIQALVVSDKYRKMGVGKKLLQAAEEWAKTMNVKNILLNCGNRPERETAHRFYVTAGFQPKSTGYVKKLDDAARG